jgi:MauM/NapG family ferredoxin protein
MKLTRRDFVKTGIGLGSAILTGEAVNLVIDDPLFSVVRPPGAKAEDSFRQSCIRCFNCGAVCPNKAIKPLRMEGGLANLYTPYITPREQGCMLCMKCSEACPTDALEKIPNDNEAILKKVNMGMARVDASICYSYNGRICGACYYSCPYPDVCLSLKLFAQPVINSDKCVGCGLCERACLHIPQAVRIIPRQSHA